MRLIKAADTPEAIGQPVHGIDVIGIDGQRLLGMPDRGLGIVFQGQQRPARVRFGQVRLQRLGTIKVPFGRAPSLLVAVAVVEQRSNRQLCMRRRKAIVERDGTLQMADRLLQFETGPMMD